MLLSRTMTAPTNLRSQVDRVDTSRAMFMKYSSHVARTRPAPFEGCELEVIAAHPNARAGAGTSSAEIDNGTLPIAIARP
jgi:hypothetical protein